MVAIFGITVSVLCAYALSIGRVRGRLPILVVFVMANTLPLFVVLLQRTTTRGIMAGALK